MNPNLSSANKSYNITGNGTTILPGKFILISLVINGKAGTGGTIAIYDSNATYGANAARKKGTLDTVNNIGAIMYGIPVFDGIYLVTGGGTTPDVTVTYAEMA